MYQITRLIIGFLLLTLVTMPASTVSPALGQERTRVRVDLTTTGQKATYLRRLVTKSVAVSTIEASDDDSAKENLLRARVLVDQAQQDLGASRIREADEKLNRALKLLNSETQRLSKRSATRKHRLAAYEKRLHTVEIFLKAYERVAGEKSMSATALAAMENLKTLIAQARGLATAGKLDEARSILARAYKTARGDIREMREGKTLVRSLNFETPEKEYQYESNRNDSHLMLLKFAINEKKPPKIFRKRIEELRMKAVNIRRAAKAQAATDHYIEAIDRLVQSTDTLLKAIRMTGLYIPG